MTNYSHIKLSDTFYPQSAYPAALQAYYKGNETSGSLIDTLGNFTLPIIGSGTVGGDGSARGAFYAGAGGGADNPTPSAFGLLDSTTSLALLDTNLHTSFMYEVVLNVPTIPPVSHYPVVLRLPRGLYLATAQWTSVTYSISFNLSSNYIPTIPAAHNLAPGAAHYIVVACLGTGTDELRVYIDKVLQYTGTFTQSANSLNCMAVGGAYDSASPVHVASGLGDSTVREIALHNGLASFANAEAIMALRMPTTVAALVSYPIVGMSGL